jgi:predicted aldo/keto reductase-like oxidoreductase
MNEVNSEKIMNEIQSVIDSGVTYIDAIVDYAERNEIEIEILGEIIRRSPVLKARIHVEAEELNMVDRVTRLPV